MRTPKEFPIILDVAFGKNEYITVFGNDYHTKDGTGVRDYIHVVDLAKGHVKALDYAAQHKAVEAVNLGTGIGYSVLQLIQTFSRVNNIEIPYQICERRAGDIDACYADPEKAEKLFGWKAIYSLEDMCRDAFCARRNREE